MRRTMNGTRIFDEASRLMSRSRTAVRRGTTQARSFVHDRPMLSLCVGIGAGFLFGWLVRRRG